jgi:Tfp pilus assembly protein PilZ
MQLALVSRAGEVHDAHVRFFKGHGVTIVHAPSISEIYRKLPDVMVSGFIIDLPILVKATSTEKYLLQSIEKIFPAVRTNWAPTAGFRAVFYDNSRAGEETLVAFLQKCLNFKARALRKHKRKEITFNVLFRTDDTDEKTAQRAYTKDISMGGLFICTCYPNPLGEAVWIKLLELDQRPFKVTVKWRSEWGVAARIPGFGGGFTDLQDSQAKLIEAVLI